MWCFTLKLTAAGFHLACVFLFKGIHGHENGNGPDVVTLTVKQGSDVILPCSLSTMVDLTSKVFDWKKDGRQEVFFYDGGFYYGNGRSGQDEQFKGRVSHFPEGLKSGNASIMIQNTKMEDSGVYTCVFPLLQPRKTFHIKLVVGPDVTLTVIQGSNVILPSSLSTMVDLTSEVFDWKKDGRLKVFFYDAGFYYGHKHLGQDEQFKERVSHFPEGLKSGNASIKIQNTKMEDSGDYTCVFPHLQPRQTFYIKLVVGPDVVTLTVKQGSDVILPCSPSTMERITSKVFDWKKDGRQEVFFYDAGIHYNNGHSGQDKQFKGRVSHFPGELKSGNASIKIQNTKMEDSGVYTCDFPRLQPRETFHIKLVVERTFKDRSGETTGAAPKPSIKIVNQTADWPLLQCEVRGAFPKPEVRWENRAGNILHAEEPKVTERGGRYDIILQTTVTKTDMYHCVATQEEISHKTDAETFVFISDKQLKDECSPAVWMTGGWFIGIITVAAVWILFEKFIIKRWKKDSHQTKGSSTSTSDESLNSHAY